MKGEVVYLYAFDVANEIITSRVQKILSAKPFRTPPGAHCGVRRDLIPKSSTQQVNLEQRAALHSKRFSDGGFGVGAWIAASI